MAFSPTPRRSTAPSQLLPLSSLVSPGGSAAVGGGSMTSVVITSSPVSGSVGVAFTATGTVSPSGSAVEVGFSAASNVAPTVWMSATVTGAEWAVSITPGSSGVFYLWAQEAGASSAVAVSAPVTISANSTSAIVFSSPPTVGVVGAALALSGTVSPAGSAVQVGLSTSATEAPASWVNAAVVGSGWTAAVTPSSAGTFYLWAEQIAEPSVQAISNAVTVGGTSGGSALTYSLIAGSGNGSLIGITLMSGTTYTSDWSSSIVAGATDVRPSVVPSSMGAIAACKFWFDTSQTNTSVPSSNYGNAGSLNNGDINFYPYNSGYGTPTAAPAAPSTPGTYYGKYAMYDSTNDMLGVFSTSAITIT